MNIYFLVEGKTEKKLYSAWLSYLIPQLKKVQFSDEADQNNYYIISGNGYPSTLTDGIPNAVAKLQESGKYNYFIISVDADEETVQDRINYVNSYLQPYQEQLNEINIKPVIIIQNRCIETWLLGNRQLINHIQTPLDSPLSDYINYYDVSQNDPELMGDYTGKNNHAQFHEKYLKALFQANHLVYSKKMPRNAQNKDYLQQLCQRIADQPEHLSTFQNLIEFCDLVKGKLASH